MDGHAKSSSPPAPQSLALETVLELFLVCFEVAIHAQRPLPLQYATQSSHPSVKAPIWILWFLSDLDDPPEDPLSSSPPVQVVDGLAKRAMCDFFCCLLESEVNKKLREICGASAHWLQFQPRASFLLVDKTEEPPYETLRHSVLAVTARDGSKYIMDGTLEQFGWARETWLLPWSEFVETRVDLSQFPCWEYVSNKTRESAEEYCSLGEGAYWAIAKQRMVKLFEELDWKQLRCLGRDERMTLVKKMAEERFAGADDEACEAYWRERESRKE